MTTLEIVFLGIIWLFVGLFICYKRDWYTNGNDISDGEFPSEVLCFVSVVLTPISLFIAFVREMVLDKWNN